MVPVVVALGRGVVGVTGCVISCCACPGGLVIVDAGEDAGALDLMLFNLLRIPGEMSVARILCVKYDDNVIYVRDVKLTMMMGVRVV